ncbi:unnamed protein product [Polarella glacialis]|uniref:Dynein heavy chain hydrolytic ATP-binding dynein motor region domain-containing protein n=1 Tax=Polarella glacialis TaxID=89957 RepID=A0A813DHK6_POLGL|nr:unnamed protein product [Polarella glacialis]CAE8605065.1 unnamed protein product [Polarella glacialis]
MLVVTPLARTARKTFFEAKTSGKMLMFKGPAGTGKTETFNDTCRELGVKACISSFSEGATSAEDVKKFLASGKYVCIDSVESMAPDVVSALPGLVKESGSFVCVSCNAETLKGSEGWADACVVLDFTLPPLAPIWDALLSCEGFVGSGKLGDKLAACLEAVKASEFFKKDEKDKNLVRFANSMVQAMGQAARVTGYDDEDKIVGQQAFKSMLSIMEEAGKDSLKGLVKEHLGVEAA